MKVNQEYAPVTVTFETQEEFELMWEIIEDTYPKYDLTHPKRLLLIAMSNKFSERVGDDHSPY